MKKLLIISLFLLGCRKVGTTYMPTTTSDIFTISSNVVTNGQTINFNLQSAGKYTLVLFDTTTNEVVSKEKFSGIVGNNAKKIYTTTFTQKTLYLYLTDSVGNQISKTKVSVN